MRIWAVILLLLGALAPAHAEEVAEQRLEAAIAAFQSGDYAVANSLLRELAEREIPAAETLLGTMAANGEGSAQNHAVAAGWFLRASRRGYAPAQLALALAFAQGRGVKRSDERALSLARAAARGQQPGAAELIEQLTGTPAQP
ncbi:MAG: hypothetical protein WCZ66_06300 [Sphingomonadaceae bacterium]